MEKKTKLQNYNYDDHSTIPFKFVRLQPALESDNEAPHRHNFFQIFFFTATGGLHLIDFEEFTCTKNSIHIVNPGSIHKLDRNPKTQGHVLLFSRTFFDEGIANSNYFLYRNDFDKFLELTSSDFERILFYIKQIEEETDHTEIFHQKHLQALLQSIVILIQRKIAFKHNTLANPTDKTYREYIDLVNKYFQEQHTVAFYAERLQIDSNKLNLLLREALDKSASTIIQERILLEAKRLLFYTNDSIKEIAYNLGYDDPSYFNRFFKSKVDQTPAAFRKSIQEKYH